MRGIQRKNAGSIGLPASAVQQVYRLRKDKGAISVSASESSGRFICFFNNKEKKDRSIENIKKNKNLIWTLVSLALAALTVSAVLHESRTVSIGDLAQAVMNSDKRWLIPAILASALYVWFEGIALRSILKRAGYVRGRLSGLLYSTADVYFSAITPSATGGQPASALFMLRDGIPGGVVTAALVLNLAMYSAAIVALGLLAVCITPGALTGFRVFSKILILLGFVILSGLVFLFILAFKKGNKIFSIPEDFIRFLQRKGWLKKADPLLARIDKIRYEHHECVKLISGRKSLIVKAFFWNFLQRASQIAVPMLVYLAGGGAKTKAWLVFAKQCLVTIGYNYVPVPGAMGVSDYLMIDGFDSIMGRETAIHIELISRGFSFYICVALSGIITLIGYLTWRKKNDRRL